MFSSYSFPMNEIDFHANEQEWMEAKNAFNWQAGKNFNGQTEWSWESLSIETFSPLFLHRSSFDSLFKAAAKRAVFLVTYISFLSILMTTYVQGQVKNKLFPNQHFFL